MNYNIHFATFADLRLKKTLNRIGRQANKMGIFNTISISNEFDLDQDFKELFKDKLNAKTRGFGYWIWKSQIILQSLNKIKEGDVLLYIDAGCHLNYKGKQRLLEYIDLAANSETGVVMFKPDDDVTLNSFEDNIEFKYTKGDLLKHFGVLNNKLVTHSNQLVGGVILVRKDSINIKFIQSLIDTYKCDFALIDDSSSKYPNFEGFIEHRHDQSIISILAKLRGVEIISASEIYTNGDWLELINYPIWTKRDKNFGFSRRIRNVLYPVYKMIFKTK